MKKENKININNLIFALLFFVLGVILLTSTDNLISIASKIIGLILIIVGLIKVIIYIYMKGKLGTYKLYELILGLLIIGCGILFFLYSYVLSFAIRNIIGIWILFSGINRIIFAISMKKQNKTDFKVYLIISLIMMIIGVCLISGFFDKLIGLFIICYSITEIVNYIYYRCKNKDLSSVSKNTDKNAYKKLKNSKIIDAVIEENNN